MGFLICSSIESRPPSHISKLSKFPNKTEESREKAGTVTATVTAPGTRRGYLLLFPLAEPVGGFEVVAT